MWQQAPDENDSQELDEILMGASYMLNESHSQSCVEMPRSGGGLPQSRRGKNGDVAGRHQGWFHRGNRAFIFFYLPLLLCLPQK